MVKLLSHNTVELSGRNDIQLAELEPVVYSSPQFPQANFAPLSEASLMIRTRSSEDALDESTMNVSPNETKSPLDFGTPESMQKDEVEVPHQ